MRGRRLLDVSETLETRGEQKRDNKSMRADLHRLYH